MKKKILIIMKSMDIGGAERSLLGLLDSFDYTKYDVDLMLLNHKGEFLKYIPKEVNLLPENSAYTTYNSPIKNLIFSKNFIYGFARILSKIEFKIYSLFTGKKANVWIKQQYTHKYITPLMPQIKVNYDLAINFLGISDFLIKKVNAKIKMGWIHTDYHQMVANRKMDIEVYKNLDYIINVSDETNRIFLEHYPEFKNKAIIIENILSAKLIKKQSEEFSVDNKMSNNQNYKKLLSIGRFGKAKNFDNISEICHRLIKKGLNVKWYIIGYGNDENLIKEKIKQFKMEDNVIILGKKENPYPYIKACDIYVQPSRYEGKAVAVREAQILKKPVIITNYATSKSQIEDTEDGFIVELESKKCAEEIYKIIINDSLLKQVIKNIEQKSFENKNEVKKIEMLLEGKKND